MRGRSVIPDKNPILDSRMRLLEVQIDTDSARGFIFPIVMSCVRSGSLSSLRHTKIQRLYIQKLGCL